MPSEQLRRVSSALFGHRYRLELLAALVAAGDKGVCLSMLANRVDVATSVFYPPLRTLSEVGMVRRVHPLGQDRRVFYVITDHPAWTGVRQMVQDLGVASIGRDQDRVVTR